MHLIFTSLYLHSLQIVLERKGVTCNCKWIYKNIDKQMDCCKKLYSKNTFSALESDSFKMIILADTKVCIKFCLYKPVLFVELTSHILVFYTVSLPQSFEYSITSPPSIHCLFRSWALVHRLIVLYCLAQKLQNIYRIIGCHWPSSLASGLYRTHFFYSGPSRQA